MLADRLLHHIRVDVARHNLDGSMLTFFFSESIHEIIRAQIQGDRERLANGWPAKSQYPRHSVLGRLWRLRRDIKHVPNVRSVSLKDTYITIVFAPNKDRHYSDAGLRAVMKSFFYPFQLGYYSVND